MKTKVEIEGYEIEISFEGGIISVTAQKDDEVVEEFSLNVDEEGQGSQEEDEDIKGFGEYDEEEEDFSDDELEDDEDDEDESQDESQNRKEGAALESFNSFIKKKRK